jgi:hypothetical protein
MAVSTCSDAVRHARTTLFAGGTWVVVVACGLMACGGGGGDGTAPGGGSLTPAPPAASDTPFWSQWGFAAQHGGAVPVAAQSLATQLADITYDPLVAAEQAESGGSLIAHYPATLTDGNDFYLMSKSGTYPSCVPAGAWTSGTVCGPNAWERLQWNATRYQWQSGQAVHVWDFASDWKPPPNGRGLNGWEPVFHPALANGVLVVPGAGGTVYRVNKTTGVMLSQINPFAGTAVVAANTYVTGPLTVDSAGNVYYNAIEFAAPAAGDPWRVADVMNAWLIRVDSNQVATKVTYAALVASAPAATSVTCPGRFSTEALPWPPALTATPAPVLCGSQRPGINIAPAVAADGTIYTVSRAHFDSLAGYLVAVNPNLTPKWHASLQRRFHDGCGVLVAIATDTTTPNTCRPGTTSGVDPTTNEAGSGVVSDLSSSTPTVLPDGSVLYGAMSNYNDQRGHLVEFDAAGNYLRAYDFGWDSTPAVWSHQGTYSIIIKDNYYDAAGRYCSRADPICQALPPGPFYITQLDPAFNIEWRFQSTSIDAAHPGGYEWCINAPAVDNSGVVLVNGEDGYLYSVAQGSSGVFTSPRQRRFLKLAIGAAYTPLSIGADGRIYTQNAGHLYVAGN